MIKGKFFLVFAILLFFGSYNKTNAQQNNVAIVLNEYCVGNFSISDNYGYQSDWVEILNAHTSSVSLSGYYLSNDKNNLYKWKFPSTFTLASNALGIVYMTGRNEYKKVGVTPYHHSNFSIDQCKNQWLILTTPQGVVRDSIFVQKTQAGHVRGRVDIFNIGIPAWRLYTIHSFSLSNPNFGFWKDYAPIPTFTPQAGWGQNGQSLDMFLNGVGPYDCSDTLNCFEIHYTVDGSIPTLTSSVYTGTNGSPIILDNQMFRAKTWPKSPATNYTAVPGCYPDILDYLPSFIQTNTYFSESSGNMDALDPRFGVISIAIDTPDTNWFSGTGSTSPLVHVEYFENKQQKLEGYATLYKPQNESWLNKQKGFYVTIDDRYGFGCNFEGPIFNDVGLGTTSRTVFPTLHVNAGDFESHSSIATSTNGLYSAGTGIRDVFLQSLAVKYNIAVNPMHIKPLITFINGKYMGAYNLREVYDKYYENYYNKQPLDSVHLNLYNFVDASVFNPIDGTTSSFLPINRFRTEVYDWATSHAGAMTSTSFYNTLMNKLDKSSFIDYMVINSYAMNSSIWNTNVAFGRGLSNAHPGNKWHYYLWNAAATFTFKAVGTNTLFYGNAYTTPCPDTYTNTTPVSALAGNGHGNVFRILMHPITGNPSFKLDYKNRYQDLLNTALKCENILAHYDYVVSLFRKEMKFHESTSSQPLGNFVTTDDLWDTNTYYLRKVIAKRCDYMRLVFGTSTSCYGMYGPYPISVDVFPSGAGTVKLNTIVLPNYIWDGNYFSTDLSFKATPTSTNYVFHHWEFKAHITINNTPLSKDSVSIAFNQPEQVRAVFTDITNDINNQDLATPSGFSPNGDGQNDDFKPLGSALYVTEYDFRVWNRWGQEVFRSTDASIGWDGNFDNKQAQTGVYAYVITYKNVYNESKIKKGNVTLVR